MDYHESSESSMKPSCWTRFAILVVKIEGDGALRRERVTEMEQWADLILS